MTYCILLLSTSASYSSNESLDEELDVVYIWRSFPRILLMYKRTLGLVTKNFKFLLDLTWVLRWDFKLLNYLKSLSQLKNGQWNMPLKFCKEFYKSASGWSNFYDKLWELSMSLLLFREKCIFFSSSTMVWSRCYFSLMLSFSFKETLININPWH